MSTLSKFTKEHIVVALANEVAGQELIEAIESAGGGGGGAVSSVNGQVGDVILTKSSIGLGNVDNTSDLNKPVSSAVQTALNAKLDLAGGTMTGNINMESTSGGGGPVTVIGTPLPPVGIFNPYSFSFVPSANAPLILKDGTDTVLGTIAVDPFLFTLQYSPAPGSPVPFLNIDSVLPLAANSTGIGINTILMSIQNTFVFPIPLKITYTGGGVTTYSKIVGLSDGISPRDAVNRQQLDSAINVHAINPAAHPQYLNKGSMIWCLPGGQYATLQDAINAASPGQTIILGEGSWGNATLKGGVNIFGLGAPRNTNIIVGQLSFSPTTGSANDNQIFLTNLFVQCPSSAVGLDLAGTAPVRLNLSGCYFFRGSGTSTLMNIVNSDVTATSVRMDGCIVNAGDDNGNLIASSVRYLRITNCELNGASRSLIVNGGITQVAFSTIEANTALMIQVSAGSVEATSASFIRNTAAGGSGVNVDLNGTFVATTSTSFDIQDGVGSYCIRGSGVVVYDAVSFNHIPVIQPRNTKFQNTLTVIQLPTTPTSAP